MNTSRSCRTAARRGAIPSYSGPSYVAPDGFRHSSVAPLQAQLHKALDDLFVFCASRPLSRAADGIPDHDGSPLPVNYQCPVICDTKTRRRSETQRNDQASGKSSTIGTSHSERDISVRQLVPGSTAARIRLLSCREHNMRRVLRGFVLRHRKSQRGQVNAAKKCLTLTEGNR